MKRYRDAAAVAALLLAVFVAPAHAAIYGTMSNFDVFNETPYNAYGAELELEGVHSQDVVNTFPSHFDHRTVTEYVNGTTFGTRVNFTGYNFNPAGYLPPTPGQSTNGHTCVNTPGCEHFGFAVSAQPSATRYFWTDATGQRITNLPMPVPTPTWSYYPPVGNNNPVLQAEAELPEAENHVQRPDAVWLKVFKTTINRPVKLKELMSDNPIVPEDEAETETEWELLERGVIDDNKDNVKPEDKAIIRRYETYKYTGAYTNEHEADTLFDGHVIVEPPAGELGDFIAANMVVANLAPLPVVEGDYNDDGVVDAGDYVAWRRHRGSEVQVEIDGDHSGRVDDGDLDVWRHHYSGSPAGGSMASSSVPEPSTCMLMMLGAVLVTVTGRRGSR